MRAHIQIIVVNCNYMADLDLHLCCMLYLYTTLKQRDLYQVLMCIAISTLLLLVRMCSYELKVLGPYAQKC